MKRQHHVSREQMEAINKAATAGVRGEAIARMIIQYRAQHDWPESTEDREQIEHEAFLAVQKRNRVLLYFEELRKAGFDFDSGVPREPTTSWLVYDELGEVSGVTYLQGESENELAG